MYFNARSIFPKIDYLRAEAVARNPLIICIVESWLSPDISDDEISIDGYQIIRLDRNRNGGGVLMFIHSSLICKHLSISSDGLELLSISVSSNHSSGKHCISVLYRPPSSSVSFFDNLHSALQELSPHSYSSFVLIGDFNINFCNRDHPYFVNSMKFSSIFHLPRLSELQLISI